MPTTNNEIHFKHGLKDNFSQITKNPDTLYFLTDTQELYLGNQRYGGDIGVGNALPQTQYQGKMFILNQNGNYSLYISDGTNWKSTTTLTEQQFETYRQEIENTAEALTQTYSDSMDALYTEYQTRLNDVIFADAQNHNGIYRGKFLDIDNEELSRRVQNGFEDLYLGDYITRRITTTLPDETVKTENVSLMIAAFNYYYNTGDTALTTPHIILIPRNQGFATIAKMNETNTTEGGYLNSYMHQTVLPCYAASLKTALNNHVLSHRTWLTKTVNTSTPSMAGAGSTGAATVCDWATVDLQLMNEVQVYGTTVWSSSAYDVGTDNRKLPVFDFITPVQFGRYFFWLRSVVSSTAFAGCYYLGVAGYGAASYAYYVRPLILFG